MYRDGVSDAMGCCARRRSAEAFALRQHLRYLRRAPTPSRDDNIGQR